MFSKASILCSSFESFSRTKDIEKEIESLRKLIDGGANHETLEKGISEVADGSESDNEVLSRSKRSVLDMQKCPEDPPGKYIILYQAQVDKVKNLTFFQSEGGHLPPSTQVQKMFCCPR